MRVPVATTAATVQTIKTIDDLLIDLEYVVRNSPFHGKAGAKLDAEHTFPAIITIWYRPSFVLIAQPSSTLTSRSMAYRLLSIWLRMESLIPKCRHRLAECDLRFIDRVLSNENSESSALQSLLSDDTERDTILDHPALFKAVLEDTDLVEISTHFYFYILVRKVLKEAEIDDCEVADYVAGVLSEHMRAPRRNAKGFDRNIAYFYVTEALEHIDRASKSERFFIRVRIANLSLIVTGLFGDHLRHRVERRAALSPAMYANIGRAQYDRVSQHALAKVFDLESVFTVLAQQFDAIQGSIEDLKERLIFLGDPMGKASTYSLFNN